jgi:hypothetical protein
MIILRDTQTIDVPPQFIWTWLETMPKHALEWHPDHISCRWLTGGNFVPGAEMEVVERLHGRRHRLRIFLTDVEPGHLVRYRIFPGLTGSFEITPADSGSTFTAQIELGVRTPVLGDILAGSKHSANTKPKKGSI